MLLPGWQTASLVRKCAAPRSERRRRYTPRSARAGRFSTPWRTGNSSARSLASGAGGRPPQEGLAADRMLRFEALATWSLVGDAILAHCSARASLARPGDVASRRHGTSALVHRSGTSKRASRSSLRIRAHKEDRRGHGEGRAFVRSARQYQAGAAQVDRRVCVSIPTGSPWMVLSSLRGASLPCAMPYRWMHWPRPSVCPH